MTRRTKPLVHLRIKWQRRVRQHDGVHHSTIDRWETNSGLEKTRSACNLAVLFKQSVSSPHRGRITCPDCAVFADAWILAGKRGGFTARRVHAFRRSLLAAAQPAPVAL